MMLTHQFLEGGIGHLLILIFLIVRYCYNYFSVDTASNVGSAATTTVATAVITHQSVSVVFCLMLEVFFI